MRLILALMLAIASTVAVAQPVDLSGGLRVMDGDTVEVAGKQYRLIGCDAPETHRAKCASERAKGEKATDTLRAILLHGVVTLERMRCSCRPGEEEVSRFCNLGRRCGVLSVDGDNVCSLLIEEGLARPFVCAEESCPRRKGWCTHQEREAWRAERKSHRRRR